MNGLRTLKGWVRGAYCLFVTCLMLTGSGAVLAQGPSPPDGCSIPIIGEIPALGPAFKELSDVVLLGACTAHDECYRECAIIDSLVFHYIHKSDCDVELIARLHGECLALTAVASQIDPDAAQQWFLACESGVVTSSILVPILGEGPYFSDQCENCCYQTACDQNFNPLPPWCGPTCLPWDPYCGGYCPPWDPYCNFRCRYPYDPFCGGRCPDWDPFCGGCMPWDPFCPTCSPWDPFCGGCSPWDFFCPFYSY